MRIDLYLHVVPDNTPPPWAVDLIQAVQALGATMSQKDDDLLAAVKANQDATASAVALIHGLADKIASAVADGTVTQAIADLRAAADTLGAAVTENTPAAPAP